MKRLELGALFHDIGKIGIPTSILLKPGPLTPEERKTIEMHPELGARILEPIDRLAEVRTIVRSCHERWDGGGYPDGRAGEEIPIEARIVARLRRVPRDDDRPALPQAAQPRRGPAVACAKVPAASSIRRSWTCS